MDQIEVLDIFEKRESIRVYDLEKPVEEEILKTILQAGILSPSSVGFEPWKFIVVQDRNILESLKHLGFGIKEQFETASAIVFICCLKDGRFSNPLIRNHLMEVKGFPERVLPKMEVRYDSFFKNDMAIDDNPRAIYDWASKQTYIALANMMTAAQMLGVQSCPIEGFNYKQMDKALRENHLNDDDNYQISVILSLGYQVEKGKRPKTRRMFDDVVKWVK